MLELAVRDAAHHDHFAAEVSQQLRPENRSGTVIAVEHDLEPLGFDRSDIDESEDSPLMFAVRVGDDLD